MTLLRVLGLRRRTTAASEAPFYNRLADLLARAGVTLVLDVGANRGQFAQALFAAGYAGRVLSFEPHPATHAALADAAAGAERWRVHPPLALGERAGTAELSSYDRSDMNSLLPAAPAMGQAFAGLDRAATVSVPVVRLDALWPEIVPAGERVMLKLDTQGSESAILEGVGDRLAEIAALQCEAAVTPLYQGQPRLGEVIARLERAGFEPALVSPGHWSRRLGRQLDLDIVFLPANPQTA